MTLSLLAVLIIQATPLDTFVAQLDGAYAVSAGRPVTETDGTKHEIRLTSQTWQGTVWKHDLILLEPKQHDYPGKAVLIITGDRGANEEEIELGWRLATTSRIAVAVLFNVPNQPLFGGLREDELLAYTLVRYLATMEDRWPLLFPMVKSVVKAMDALGDYSHQKLATKLDKFIITGASKRGWTTYLAGAVDQRAIAIAPMVFDFLNFPKQLKNQIDLWGKYSPMLAPYTGRGLEAAVDTPEGKALLERVDPHRYLGRLRMPKLILLGSNDSYWATNSLNLYWDDLSGPKFVLYVPNSGHSLEDKDRLLYTLAAFVRTTASGRQMPTFHWVWNTGALAGTTKLVEASLQLRAPTCRKMRLWLAESETQNFSDSKWRPVVDVPFAPELIPPAATGKQGYRAMFGEAEFEVDGIVFNLSTQPTIVWGR